MKVLGIGGSPKKGGFTDKALDNALSGAGSAGAIVKKIILNDLGFKPCQDCGGCREDGICRIRDDMQAVYREVESADAVIIASPVFFCSVTAQVKMMVDRFQCAWVAKHLLGKRASRRKRRKGVFLCAGGANKKGHFENARQIIRALFATLDIDYAGELFISKSGSEKKSFELGKSLAK